MAWHNFITAPIKKYGEGRAALKIEQAAFKKDVVQAIAGVGVQATGIAEGVAYRLGRTGPLGALKGGAKLAGKGLMGGAVAAGVVALGSYLAFADRGKKLEAEPQMPPLLTPQDLMAQQSMMMEAAGPAEGYAPNQWQQMVAAGRGQQLGQEQANPAQPRMSAVSPEAVSQLGANSRIQSA